VQEIERKTPQELGVDITPHLQTVEVTEPPARKAGKKVQTAQELVEALRKEGVIA
jgi:electron transfer flavoprotein beta subunit